MSVCICAILKNEARYVPEWLAYHIAIGVEHFYLYDNDSTDSFGAVIENSMFRDLVTITHWPGERRQLDAYQDVFLSRPDYTWTACIDIDEFLLPLTCDNVDESLSDFGQCSAVLVNWLNFGPSGRLKKSERLIIDSYLQRFPDSADVNRHVKSVVRTKDWLGVSGNPHVFNTTRAQCYVDRSPAKASGFQDRAVHGDMVLNHYFTKSFEEWTEKRLRGRATTTDTYDDGPFWNAWEHATVYDGRILKYLPKVEALMAVGFPQVHRGGK